MKLGVLYNRNTQNVGDDIQAYAVERLLPRADLMLDRENMSKRDATGHDPIAVVMAAWFMGRKWKWPPADNIRPLFTSFHYTDFGGYPYKYLRSQYEYLSGPGADYLRSWGPVGCRDEFTAEELNKRGIEAYFSGCVTLTLPPQPRTEDAGSYVCLVDVVPGVEKKVRELLKGTGLRIVKCTHKTTMTESTFVDYETRKKELIRLLTLYQNARCVVTRRLHVSLPCLAMGTPVLLVHGNLHPSRFRPYCDWIRNMTPRQFIDTATREMLTDPEPNSTAYLPYREALIAQITEWGKTMAALDDCPPHSPIPYTETEYLRWHDKVMADNLMQWYTQSKGLFARINTLEAEKKELARAAGDKKTKILARRSARLSRENAELQAQLSEKDRLLSKRLVKKALKLDGFLRKIRDFFRGKKKERK